MAREASHPCRCHHIRSTGAVAGHIMSLLPSTFRRRSFFALGAVTFTLGLTAHWRSISHGLARPLLFRSQSSFPFTLPPAAPAMAHLRAPQPPPKWDHTAADILALTKEAIANDKSVPRTSSSSPYMLTSGLAQGGL